MALSNAERQARHRERQKEKLRNAPPSEPLRNEVDVRRQMGEDVMARLRQAYYGQVDTLRKHINGDHIEGLVDAAVDEFMAEHQIGFEDIINIVELAGYARLGEFFEIHCNKSDLPARPPEWIRHKKQLADMGVT